MNKEIRVSKEPNKDVIPDIPCFEFGITPDNCFFGALGFSLMTFNSVALGVISVCLKCTQDNAAILFEKFINKTAGALITELNKEYVVFEEKSTFIQEFETLKNKRDRIVHSFPQNDSLGNKGIGTIDKNDNNNHQTILLGDLVSFNKECNEFRKKYISILNGIIF